MVNMSNIKFASWMALSIILVLACQKQKPKRFTTSSPQIEVIKSTLKAYESGNWEAWDLHYADGAKIYINSLEGISSKELSDNFKEILKNISSYGFSHKEGEIFFERILDDKGGEWVYFWGTWKGTVAEINKEITMPVHIAFEMSGDQIAKEYAYYDPSDLRTAIVEKQVAEMSVEEIIE